MQIEAIPQHFGIAGNINAAELGTGHINRTYLVTAENGSRYILQSLNRSIFHSPEKIMDNIRAVGAALKNCSEVKIPWFLSSGGKNYFCSDGELWRMYTYCESAGSTDHYSAGKAYGAFIRVMSLSGLSPEASISGFHNFGEYLRKLRAVSPPEKLPSGLNELAEINAAPLPTRVIHGDAKLDNIIMGDPCTIIDLDTVMQGHAATDYGDLIRSACTGGIDLNAVRNITAGFADGLDGLLSAGETASLYDGIRLVTGELAIRYLTDYYSSERYFRSKAREQCLERYNELMKQLDEFSSAEKDIRSIIDSSFDQVNGRIHT